MAVMKTTAEGRRQTPFSRQHCPWESHGSKAFEGRPRTRDTWAPIFVAVHSCHPRAADEPGRKPQNRVRHQKARTGRSTSLGSGWWAGDGNLVLVSAQQSSAGGRVERLLLPDQSGEAEASGSTRASRAAVRYAQTIVVFGVPPLYCTAIYHCISRDLRQTTPARACQEACMDRALYVISFSNCVISTSRLDRTTHVAPLRIPMVVAI